MKKITLAFLLLSLCLNVFAIDCQVSTDRNGDGTYDYLILDVLKVTNTDMVFIFKDGSTHRQQKDSDVINTEHFSVDSSKINASLEGSKIIAFGTQGSTVAVVARHVAGTQQDFESLSAGAFDVNAPYGVLVDYTTKLKVACFK